MIPKIVQIHEPNLTKKQNKAKIILTTLLDGAAVRPIAGSVDDFRP
jgi:hypothetical protein